MLHKIKKRHGNIKKFKIDKLYGWNEKTDKHPRKKGNMCTNNNLLLSKKLII